jgi:plasmid stability protein
MKNQKGTDVWRGQMRIPGPMIAWVKLRADASFRSLNAEMVEIIREAMQKEAQKDAPQ